MAIDEALLRNANSDWPIVLRVYQWERPTLSIGHFQRIEDRETVPNLRDLPWVRRKTGGGAIVHDHELTYSILIPKRDDRPTKGHNELLYRAIHWAVADSLIALGWNARFSEACKNKTSCTMKTINGKNQEPFLCFLRRTPIDLVVGDDKILGSAQRRSAAGLLQHGSFLLRRSQSALELSGLLDASNGSSAEPTNRELDGWIDFFVASLTQGVSQLFPTRWYNGSLDDLFGDVKEKDVISIYG